MTTTTMPPEQFWNDYQEQTQSTAIYPGQGSITGMCYVGLKLVGETGEVTEHLGKALRDDGGELTEDRVTLLSKEIGDALWYIARAAREVNMKLSTVIALGLDDLRAADIPGRGTPTARTCIGLGLARQAGDVASRILTVLTRQAGTYMSEDKDFLAARLANAFHWLNQLAVECGLDLRDIADENRAKLQRRKNEGTLQGSGSDR